MVPLVVSGGVLWCMSSALAYADKHRLPELAHEALPVLNEGSRDYWVARSIDCLLYVQEDGYPIRQYIRKKVRLPGEMLGGIIVVTLMVKICQGVLGGVTSTGRSLHNQTASLVHRSGEFYERTRTWFEGEAKHIKDEASHCLEESKRIIRTLARTEIPYVDSLLQKKRSHTESQLKSFLEVTLANWSVQYLQSDLLPELVLTEEQRNRFLQEFVQSRVAPGPGETEREVRSLLQSFFTHVGPSLTLYQWSVAAIWLTLVEWALVPILQHFSLFALSLAREKMVSEDFAKQFALLSELLAHAEVLLERATSGIVLEHTSDPVPPPPAPETITVQAGRAMRLTVKGARGLLQEAGILSSGAPAVFSPVLNNDQRRLQGFCLELSAFLVHAYVDKYFFWRRWQEAPVLGAVMRDIEGGMEVGVYRPIQELLQKLLYSAIAEPGELNYKILCLADAVVAAVDSKENLGSYVEQKEGFANLQALVTECFCGALSYTQHEGGGILASALTPEALDAMMKTMTQKLIDQVSIRKTEDLLAGVFTKGISVPVPHPLSWEDLQTRLQERCKQLCIALYRQQCAPDTERLQALLTQAREGHLQDIDGCLRRLQELFLTKGHITPEEPEAVEKLTKVTEQLQQETSILLEWIDRELSFNARIDKLPEATQTKVRESFLSLYQTLLLYTQTVQNLQRHYEGFPERQKEHAIVLQCLGNLQEDFIPGANSLNHLSTALRNFLNRVGGDYAEQVFTDLDWLNSEDNNTELLTQEARKEKGNKLRNNVVMMIDTKLRELKEQRASLERQKGEYFQKLMELHGKARTSLNNKDMEIPRPIPGKKEQVEAEAENIWNSKISSEAKERLVNEKILTLGANNRWNSLAGRVLREVTTTLQRV